jgi:hypothetical protein
MIKRLGNAEASSEAYMEAKLALIRMQAHQTIERTDASARKVEEALVRFARAAKTGGDASIRG